MTERLPDRAPLATRRGLLAGGCGLALAALAGGCDRRNADPEPEASTGPAGPAEGSLEWAVAGPWRAGDRTRDQWRHPVETLQFFGIRPSMTVLEFWPGSGWYTEILAPYLARGNGRLYAAGFETGPGADPAQVALAARFEQRFSDRRTYGDVVQTQFGPTSGPVAPAGSCDLALMMRNIHAWMASGIAEKAFVDAFSALRPGGILGIEQHRANIAEDQDPAAANGYVQEAFVRQLAAEAGFVFVASSDVNTNENDTKDHPFGVDTLPPTGLTAPRGSPPDPSFDREPYDTIGESDRMTLKFRKPE